MTYTSERYDFSDKRAGYEQLAMELRGLLAGESDSVANAANTAALISMRCRRSTGPDFISCARA